jgi:hypothetical protein
MLAAGCGGWPSLLVFVVHAKAPATVPCPACAKPRPLATSHCPHCAAAWPPPPAIELRG